MPGIIRFLSLITIIGLQAQICLWHGMESKSEPICLTLSSQHLEQLPKDNLCRKRSPSVESCGSCSTNDTTCITIPKKTIQELNNIFDENNNTDPSRMKEKLELITCYWRMLNQQKIITEKDDKAGVFDDKMDLFYNNHTPPESPEKWLTNLFMSPPKNNSPEKPYEEIKNYRTTDLFDPWSQLIELSLKPAFWLMKQLKKYQKSQ